MNAQPEQQFVDAMAAAEAWLAQRDGLRDSLLAEREALLARLGAIDSALCALGGRGPKVRVPATGQHKPNMWGDKTRKVVAFLQENPGASTPEMLSATGIARSFLPYLKHRKLVRREGGGRTAKWFSIAPRPTAAKPTEGT